MFQKIINSLFGNNRVCEFEVLFGAETAGKGEHGILSGTWVKEGKPRETAIPFYFVGAMHPPKLSMAVMEELFHHARFVGIVPTHIYAYGNLAQLRRTDGPRSNVTPLNHTAPVAAATA